MVAHHFGYTRNLRSVYMVVVQYHWIFLATINAAILFQKSKYADLILATLTFLVRCRCSKMTRTKVWIVSILIVMSFSLAIFTVWA